MTACPHVDPSVVKDALATKGVRRGLSVSVAPPSWRLSAFAGRLGEISGNRSLASLTLAFRLVLEAQRRGDPVAWISRKGTAFFPPDVADVGVDLASLVVVWVPETREAPRAADYLVRSGAFGLVILDFGSDARMPVPVQSRLVGLAQKHDTALLCLTEKDAQRPSLGSLVAVRAEASRTERTGDRYRCVAHILKDKRRGPGWRHTEVSVDRMACVDLPAYPLQLLLQRQPRWQDHPVAVVDSDKPQGVILWVNERARARRILPGMRYAAGLSLAGDLRAAEVSPAGIERSVATISRGLRRFTPEVEPSADEPGVFWLDASGLERLYDSLRGWACQIRSALKRSGFLATVITGFGRFGTYATAKAKRGVIVFKTLADERAAARRVPLDRLAIDPAVRDALGKLGIRTVGRFIDLPAEGIEKRFGPQVGRLYRLASGELHLPLQPEKPPPPALQRLALDHPETNVARLMITIKQLLHPLLEILANRCQALTEVHIGFCFERTGDHIERVRPAAPTLDASQLLELIRLRLEAVRKLPDGVVEVVLSAQGVRAAPEQLRLFAQRPRRDLAAANRALARVRAAYGDEAVTRARLREGHLPEGSFTWDAVDVVPAPQPRDVDTSQLVRRIYNPPLPLPSRPRHEPDGWMLRGLKQGPVTRVLGPYIVSGGWWKREVHREYHFAETQKGELLWVYYDRARRKWFLHGRVE